MSTPEFLRDPAPRPRHHTIISVDDHVVEPPDLFAGRLPAALADRAPRVIETPSGKQLWTYEDRRYPNVALNAIAGYPREQWGIEPARFDEVRPGCYRIDDRISDMDIGGIWASANFPSLIAGFAGSVFSSSEDPELGLAVTRAYNDWHLEEWAAPFPDRIIPVQIPWLADVAVAVEEIYHNAERGFRAVTFSENPVNQGAPSIHSGAWDPFLRACAETETVVCLHVGSGRLLPPTSPDAPFEVSCTLFAASAISAAAEWLWSGVAVRFPDLRIALSEGGVSWVPMFLERVDYVWERQRLWTGTWRGTDLRPSEVFRRNFWFCSLHDPAGLALRHEIGVDHIMVESDYPHGDSTWPDTQLLLAEALRGVPDDEAAAISHLNAARLFRHPLPPRAWLDAEVATC